MADAGFMLMPRSGLRVPVIDFSDWKNPKYVENEPTQMPTQSTMPEQGMPEQQGTGQGNIVNPLQYGEVPEEVAPPLAQGIAPYFGHQVNKLEENWYRMLGIEAPTPFDMKLKNEGYKNIPALSGPTFDYGKFNYESEGSFARQMRLPSQLLENTRVDWRNKKIDDNSSLLDQAIATVPFAGAISEAYKDWSQQGERMYREAAQTKYVPTMHDMMRATAIVTNHQSLHAADFFVDITNPSQQANIARVRNDLLWANDVILEYSKTHGSINKVFAGIVGGAWGMAGSPLNLMIDGMFLNLGGRIGAKIAAPLGLRGLGYFGDSFIGKAAARAPYAATGAIGMGGASALKRDLEWNVVGPRMAGQLGVDVKDLDKGVEEAFVGGAIAGGVGGVFRRNATILKEARYNSWYSAFTGKLEHSFTSITDKELGQELQNFMKSQPKDKPIAWKDWESFINDRIAMRAQGDKGRVLKLSNLGIPAPEKEHHLDAGSVLDLKDKYKVEVQGSKASYSKTHEITNELDLAEAYSDNVIRKIEGMDPKQASTYFGRVILNLSNGADANHKIILNNIYKGLDKVDSEILYKKTLDPKTNEAFYNAIVKKDPTLFRGHLSSDANSEKFIRNVLEANDSIVELYRNLGVALDQLEDGYIRQSHHADRIGGVTQETWTKETFDKLDLKKSYPEIMDPAYISKRMQELEGEIQAKEVLAKAQKTAEKEVKQRIKDSEAKIQAIEGKENKTAAEKNMLLGEKEHVRSLQAMLSDTTADQTLATVLREERKNIAQEAKDWIKIARDIVKGGGIPSPMANMIKGEVKDLLKIAKKKSTNATEARARTEGMIEATKRIRKTLVENKLHSGQLSAYAERRATMQTAVNFVKKNIKGFGKVSKKVRKGVDKNDRSKFDEYVSLYQKEDAKRLKLFESKLKDETLTGHQLDGWVKAAKAFAKEVDDRKNLRSIRDMEMATERVANKEVRELTSLYKRAEEEVDKSAKRDKRAKEKEAREYEKEGLIAKKRHAVVQGKLDKVVGGMEAKRKIQKELSSTPSATELANDPNYIQLKTDRKDLTKDYKASSKELKDAKAKPVGDNGYATEAEKQQEVAQKQQDFDQKKSALTANKTAMDDIVLKKGGVQGRNVELYRLRKEKRLLERTIAKDQADFTYKLRGIRNLNENSRHNSELRELKKEYARLEANSNLTPDERNVRVMESLNNTYREITGPKVGGTARVGGTGKLHKQRSFHFKDFNSWDSYQQSYGHRMSAFQSMIDHARDASKKASLFETLGPDPNLLRDKIKPYIERLLKQDLPKGTKRQVERYASAIDSLLDYDPHMSLDSSRLSKFIDNLGVFAMTDFLKNVFRFVGLYDPMQMSFWGQKYGIVKKGAMFGQINGLRNALRAFGAIGKRGGELLRLIPESDRSEMSLAGLLYQSNRMFLQTAEKNLDLSSRLVKFSKNMGKAFGSDLMQEISYLNSSTLWTYRVGEFVGGKVGHGQLSNEFKAVLRRHGIYEAQWDKILAHGDSGMITTKIFQQTHKGIPVKSFSAIEMMRNATDAEIKELGRKMYYAQNDFVRVGAMQSDPLLSAAQRSLINSEKSKGLLGGMYNKMTNSLFTFSGYPEHLQTQLTQHALESAGTSQVAGALINTAPGVASMTQYIAHMFAATFLTNAGMDILGGREPRLNAVTVGRAVASAGSFGILGGILFEQSMNNMLDDIGHGDIWQAGSKAIGGKFIPPGAAYALNKGAYATKAAHAFLNGDNANAMYYAQRSVPFLDHKAIELFMRRVIIDNVHNNIDHSAAYRSWLKESKAAQRSGRPYMDATRPGALADSEAPRVK